MIEISLRGDYKEIKAASDSWYLLFGGFNIMSDLANKKLVPGHGDVHPLKGADLHALSHQLPNWEVVNEHHIHRVFKFPDFQKALDFVNRVGAIAEEQGHHPDILLTWGKVEITTWTHTVNGITESDFTLAAKIDEI